jgi:hypothetical protein
MKETTKNTVTVLEITDKETDKSYSLSERTKEQTKYFKISKITSRVNAMDFLTSLEAICKSPKDIRVINWLLDSLNSAGELQIVNISKEANNLGVARSKLNLLLTACVSSKLFYKIDKGFYLVNPFVFVGKRTRSNTDRESLQARWSTLQRNQ